MCSILYSDSHIVVCIKPAGVLSQEPGMPALLKAQLSCEAVHVVHRLDKEVGGLMVYALTQKAAAGLSRAIQERTLQKEYLAVLTGVPTEPSAALEDLLFHDQRRNKTYVVDRQRKGVKDARLDYTVLKQTQTHALVHVRLHTGRTHQIRVQFASRQLPLAGDRKYGGKCADKTLALWSHRLAFPHPITGKPMDFQAPPPQELPWSQFNG